MRTLLTVVVVTMLLLPKPAQACSVYKLTKDGENYCRQ
jgi:hypothetical protein